MVLKVGDICAGFVPYSQRLSTVLYIAVGVMYFHVRRALSVLADGIAHCIFMTCRSEWFSALPSLLGVLPREEERVLKVKSNR